MVGVARQTVANVLKKAGAIAYHRKKTQAMKPLHQQNRVKFATWALNQYGKAVNGNTTWGRLVNTDFSAMVKKSGHLNTKNDIIWSRSMEEAGDKLEFVMEKYEDSFMIWGGVSLKGLIPSEAPIFVCDLKDEWTRLGNPKTRGVTGDMYAHMVTKYVVPAVNQLYGERAVWQDDPATIHRTANALEACSAFRARVPHDEQASKMADIWPIENVWAIVKDRVKAEEPKDKAALKRVIKKVWKEINLDKVLCKKLMKSIPARLEAVISVDGRQVRKEDYEGRREE